MSRINTLNKSYKALKKDPTVSRLLGDDWLLWLMIKYNECYSSNNNEERSLFCQGRFFVDQHDFFELSIVHDVCSQIIEIVGLSHLISEFSMNWHCFDLYKQKHTWRVIVAPDSKSPNLKKPVHMWVSLLKNLKNPFLNSGNFFSQGKPVSYSIS